MDPNPLSTRSAKKKKKHALISEFAHDDDEAPRGFACSYVNGKTVCKRSGATGLKTKCCIHSNLRRTLSWLSDLWLSWMKTNGFPTDRGSLQECCVQ